MRSSFIYIKNEADFQKCGVVFYLQKKLRSSSILSIPAGILTENSEFDTPTGLRRVCADTGAGAIDYGEYGDNRANSAQLKLELGLSLAIFNVF